MQVLVLDPAFWGGIQFRQKVLTFPQFDDQLLISKVFVGNKKHCHIKQHTSGIRNIRFQK